MSTARNEPQMTFARGDLPDGMTLEEVTKQVREMSCSHCHAAMLTAASAELPLPVARRCSHASALFALFGGALAVSVGRQHSP